MTLLLVLGALGADVGKGAAAPAHPAVPVVRVAQAPDPVALAAADVARAERARGAVVAQRAALEDRYRAQTAEIDKLKRQRASWRRDRALRDKLAESVETAQALERLARDLAAADAEVGRARARGVAAIDGALATVTDARKAELTARRARWAPPPPRIKRIVIPDDQLDPLADPEDLDQQAADLAHSETELAGVIAGLDAQAQRFDRQAALRRQHSRAEEMANRDEVDPRPGVAGPGSGATLTDGDASPAPGGEDNPAPEAAFDRDATALSAVVDPGTIDVLRSAGLSNDPAKRAQATRAARQAVADRLARLKQQRAAIEARARQLRKP